MTQDEALRLLSAHRESIDELDREILRVLNERTRVVEQIGSVKQQSALPVYEPKREEEVFRNVISNNAGPLPSDAVRRIFERIVDEMRTLQKQKMTGAQQRGA